MKRPAELYAASPRPYHGLPELTYPFHDRDILVTACGRICLHRKKINISTVLAGQRLGIKEVDDGIWLVSFMPDRVAEGVSAQLLSATVYSCALPSVAERLPTKLPTPRRSVSICGRPPGDRDFQRQYRRKPARCQRTMVSGRMIVIAFRTDGTIDTAERRTSDRCS